MGPRVLFVITDLLTGGAERQLARMLSYLHPGLVEAEVVSLHSEGPVSAEIRALGVPVSHLGLDNLARLPAAAAKLGAIARRFRPDVVQGWMYHGNVAARWVHLVSRARLVFGVRQSLYDLSREKRGTRLAIRWNAAASRHAAAVVYNSETARAQHEAIGFAPDRGKIIDNGFDPAVFRPDDEARRSVRAELNMAPDAPLVGLIARYHPMKGHDVFLAAARQLAERRADVHFLLAGRGLLADAPPFAPWAGSGPFAQRLHFLGERSDLPRITAALDVASSCSSWGEAFPNAIGEAMNCGVPCVATDVGDARRIVADTGIIVRPGDVEGIAAAWDRILQLPREERGRLAESARDRMVKNFGLEAAATRYAALYR